MTDFLSDVRFLAKCRLQLTGVLPLNVSLNWTSFHRGTTMTLCIYRIELFHLIAVKNEAKYCYAF